MDTIVGKYVIIDNASLSTQSIDPEIDTTPYEVYEVIRIIDGIPLFLEDHITRMKVSLQRLHPKVDLDPIYLSSIIKKLVFKNAFYLGNIKVLSRTINQQLFYSAYFIPHIYPVSLQYEKGVRLKSVQLERTDPNIKQVKVNDSIKKKVGHLLQEVFEVLLYDNDQIITEGSRSNFFLIRNNQVITAPDHYVLKGITRERVINLCHENNIEVVKHPVMINELAQFEAAFVCGTSPKVMPINQIDNFHFNTKNKILVKIMDLYDKLIEEYVADRKSK